MTLAVGEFLRRFLLHVLPRRFVRIRYFGFLAHRRRVALLPVCRRLLAAPRPSQTPTSGTTERSHRGWNCPLCGGRMRVLERLTAAQFRLRSPPLSLATA